MTNATPETIRSLLRLVDEARVASREYLAKPNRTPAVVAAMEEGLRVIDRIEEELKSETINADEIQDRIRELMMVAGRLSQLMIQGAGEQ